MATYDNDLRLTELTTGDEIGSWGDVSNLNLELIAESLSYATQDGFASDADATTTVADGATDPARSMYFKVTSSATLTATRTLTIAPNDMSRVMFIENATTGGQSITIAQGSGGTVTIPNGANKLIYLDGAGAGGAVVDISSKLALDGTTIGGTTPAAGTFTAVTVDNIVIDGDVINYGSGDVTQTFTANSLAFAGGNNYVFDVEPGDTHYVESFHDTSTAARTIHRFSSDVYGAQTSALSILANGALSWNSGDVTATYSTNALAFAGASSGYSFDADTTVTGDIFIEGSTSSIFVNDATNYNGRVVIHGSDRILDLRYDGASAGNKFYGIKLEDGAFRFQHMSDNTAQRRDFLKTTRSGGVAVTTMEYGNSTDNPSHTFYGNVGIGTPPSYTLHTVTAATTGLGHLFNGNTVTSGQNVEIQANGASFSGINLYSEVANGSATGKGIQVSNAGTGNAVFIDQNGNGIALNIDHEGTTAAALNVDGANTTGDMVTIVGDSLTTGQGLDVYSNNASFSNTAGLVNIAVDNPSATGNSLRVKQDGTGDGVFIDQNGNGLGLRIDSEASTATNFQISSQNTSGIIAQIKSNNVQTSGQVLLVITENASSDADTVSVRNDGTGTSVYIDHNNAAGYGLHINGDQTTSYPQYIQADSLTTGSGLYVKADNATFSGNVGYFYSQNSSGTGTALRVRQDGTGNGVFIDQNGDYCALNVDAESSAVSAIQILADNLTTATGLYLRSNSASHSNYLQYLFTNNASASATTLGVRNQGTGNGIFVDQDGNGIALNIDSECTTGHVIYASGDQATSANVIVGYTNSASFNGNAIYGLVDNPSATGNAGAFYNDGVGNGVFIDQNGNGTALYIDHAGTSTRAIDIVADSIAGANAIRVKTNSSSATTRGILYIHNQNASATGAVPGWFQQDAAGIGVQIDQNGNGIALNIDSEATSQSAVIVRGAQTGNHVVQVIGEGANNNGVIYGYQNNASFGGNVFWGWQDNASATGRAAYLRNDGTGHAVFIDNNGSGYPLYIDNAGSSASIYISGNDPSILLHDTAGTTGDWSIRNTDDSLTIRDVSSGIDKLNVSASGVTVTNGQLIEEYATTGTSGAVTINLNGGNVFATPMTGAVTYTFTNPAANGLSSSFTLKVVNNGSAITWPGSVDWPGGTAPTLSASGETDVFVFFTHDGGTTWYGFTAGQAMA